jgi:DnaD/phage-associated family protein
MTSPYWLKLWIEIIDDPKVIRMPDWLFRRFILMLANAKEYDRDGLLPPVDDIALRIRLTDKSVAEALSALSQIGVTRETADGWMFVNFAKRQKREDSTNAERQRRHREKISNAKSNASPSVSVSTSVSDSISVTLTQPNIFKHYEDTIGIITPTIADKLKLAEKEYPEKWVTRAFEISADQDKRSWAYVAAILERWRRDGYDGDKKNGNKPKRDDRTSDAARRKYAEIP